MKYYLSILFTILAIGSIYADNDARMHTPTQKSANIDQIEPNKLYSFDITNRTFSESLKIEDNGYIGSIEVAKNLEIFHDILKANTPAHIELTQQTMLIQNIDQSSYKYEIMWEGDNIFVKNEISSKWDYFGYIKENNIYFQVVLYKRIRPASTIKRPVVILGADYFLEDINDITLQDDLENKIISYWMKVNMKATLTQ